jgi:hypothetical protein
MAVRFRAFAVLFLALFVAAACGDSQASSNTDVREGSETDPKFSDEYFMVPAGDEEMMVNVTEAAPVSVYLYSKKTGDPVDGQTVNFEILEEVDGVSLSALSAATETDGSSSVDLRAGNESTTVKVRADHPSSNAVDFTIEILPLEVGGLKVKATNTAPSIMDLVDVEIRLYRNSEFSCDEFRPLFEAPEPVTMQTMPRAGETVTFEDLTTRNEFLITGIARGERGQIAAGGCMDGVPIEADVTREVELLLQLIPLNPVGTYDVTSHWDFTEAVAESGAVGETIVRILNLFENPGQAIYDEIINLVESLVGGIISGAIDTFLDLTGLDEDFQNMINDFIADNEALSKIFQAGSDLRDVIANLEVHSELTIGKLSSNYEFRGSDNWLGLTLYWRWDCDENSPPDCGAIPLVIDDQGEIGDLGVLSSEWTGRIVAYDQLQIDTHTMSLRYGRLIIYVLNDIILPELTNGNAHSLSEAFAYWIGCDSLAMSITGSDGEICALGACVEDDQIENFCTSAVSTLFGFADLLVRGLEFDIGLRLGGEGTLVEIDSDGRVDRIEDGTFEGFLQSNENGMSSPFTATWEAERRNNDTNGL